MADTTNPTTPAAPTGLPTATIEDGNILTIFVPGFDGIKDMSKPTVAELNKEGNLNLSQYLDSTGWKLNHTQEMIKDDREASAQSGEIPGAEKFDGGSLQIVNNVNTDEPNEAFETLRKGVQGYFVRRRNKTQLAFEAGQTVSVFKVTIGITVPVAHAENNLTKSQTSFSVAPGSYDETATVAA
ncbi:hypothetical protein [Bifidobacterium polysaccharolyticum]|uniref:Phage tail protein n=1 Tax=Bifidobacterium polysaccharolyticum TaxID=2750967 RepID=A0ABS0QWH8_9BIFI|nr:hypothetical protein [Bifidobacterium polysaccharolyticum]MBI0106184.1 hypothetical protein [Bifidobacterium polysaccharolyticum]